MLATEVELPLTQEKAVKDAREQSLERTVAKIVVRRTIYIKPKAIRCWFEIQFDDDETTKDSFEKNL